MGITSIGQRWKVYDYEASKALIPQNGEMMILSGVPEYGSFNVFVIGDGTHDIEYLMDRRQFSPVHSYALVSSVVFLRGVNFAVTDAPYGPAIFPLTGDGTSTVEDLVTDWAAAVDSLSEYLKDFRAYSADRIYGLNDPCFYAGVPYRSKVGSNQGNQPNESPNEWEVTGGGSGAATEPGYGLSNGQFDEKQVTDWAAYADAAGATPVDGDGGSPVSTFTHNTTSPLVGTGDGLFTKGAANRQGEGFSTLCPIDRGLVTGTAQVSFIYETSAGYVDGDMGVFLYDITNAALIPISVNALPATYGKPSKFLATFIPSTSTSYRLIFHVVSTSAAAYTVKVDDVQVGAKGVSIGAAVGNWQAYTPYSNIAGASHVGYWRRVGSSMEVRISTSWSSGATVSAGTFVWGLPPGYTMAPSAGVNGCASAYNIGISSVWNGTVGTNGTSNLTVEGGEAGAISPWGASIPFSWIGSAAGSINLQASVPIAQWTSNVNLASDFTEYAYNSSTTDASDTTSFAHGSEGILVRGVGGITKRVRFEKPFQATDKVSLEFQRTDGPANIWYPYEGCAISGVDPFLRNGSNNAGCSLSYVNSTDLDIVFAPYRAATGATYGATGAPWADVSTILKWRVRKVSNGNMAEVPPVVRAEYGNQSTGGATVPLNYATKLEDTHSCVTIGASWKFTAPIGGVYLVTATVRSSTTSYGRIALYKNGVLTSYVGNTPNISGQIGIQTVTIRLAVGDYIDVRALDWGLTTSADDKITVTRLGS